MPADKLNVGEDWFAECNDEDLSDEELLADAAAEAAAWAADLAELRHREKTLG